MLEDPIGIFSGIRDGVGTQPSHGKANGIVEA
jgi:hypothetical protein